MDAINTVSRTLPQPSWLEQLPEEILRKTFSYLPLRMVCSTVGQVSHFFNQSSNYLRVANMVQARVRAFATAQNQQQSLDRFRALMEECLSAGGMPENLTVSMLHRLIDTLPKLPYNDHATALSAVLEQCRRLPPASSKQLSKKCMNVFLNAHNIARIAKPNLSLYKPANNHEAALAAETFCYTPPNAATSNKGYTNCLDELKHWAEWTAYISDPEKRSRCVKTCLFAAKLTVLQIGEGAEGRTFSSKERQEVDDLRHDFVMGAFRLLAEPEMGLDRILYMEWLRDFAGDDARLRHDLSDLGARLKSEGLSEATALRHVIQACEICGPELRQDMYKMALATPDISLRITVLEILARAVCKNPDKEDELAQIYDALIIAEPTTPVSVSKLLARAMVCDALDFEAIVSLGLAWRVTMMRPGMAKLNAVKDIALGLLKACARDGDQNEMDKFAKSFHLVFPLLLEAVFPEQQKASEKEKAACARFYHSLHAELSAMAGNDPDLPASVARTRLETFQHRI